MMRNISIREDFHCHTDFSHGENSAEQMIEAAIELGLSTIAITEHVRRDTPWFAEYLAEIGRLKEKYHPRIKVLCGLEAKTIDWAGTLDARADWCAKVDLVLGAIHSIPRANNGYYEPNETPTDEMRDAWQKTLAGLFKNPDVDIIAHPFYELNEYGLVIDKDSVDRLINLAAATNKTIEISMKHRHLNKALIVRLKQAGVKTAVGSDAHSVRELRQLHDLKRQLYV